VSHCIASPHYAPLCFLFAEDPAGEAPSECVGELRLERVSFRYPARPDVMVMRDFSLEVKAGEPCGANLTWAVVFDCIAVKGTAGASGNTGALCC
jgi:ABC-type multidrug transport system fused ATPase/permease subunit